MKRTGAVIDNAKLEKIRCRNTVNQPVRCGSWQDYARFIVWYGRKDSRNIYLDEISNPDKYTERFVIEQYTGLTDKNGKKIFEGDIVRYGKGIYEWNKKDWEFEVGIIEFKDGAFIINDIYSSDGYNELSCLYHEINYSGKYDSGTLLEVIGNIYDNPELIRNEV